MLASSTRCIVLLLAVSSARAMPSVKTGVGMDLSAKSHFELKGQHGGPAKNTLPLPDVDAAMRLKGGSEAMKPLPKFAGSNPIPGTAALFGGQPSTLWLFSGVLTALCLLSAHVASIIGNCVGLAYPTYCSLKVLEEGSKDTVASHTKLLTYWVTFAVVQLAESVFAPITSSLPHYHAAKVALLIWMQHEGARAVYTRWLQPLHREHTQKVEGFVEEGCSKVEKALSDVRAQCSQGLRSALRKIINSKIAM
mmetsp:Transcript_45376/g.107618  ORF Transcript_45376/g.107618 Transcript_45376/m.107618 type:complete len:251 (+) Transcript_45376:119-871(+)|eukprot:CAMPEP_0177696162 /NCGR_PEP_ID=MMETSP0484_2-20121128/3834_1 /TAXON_ID=354590 /ORGANISM="Rhodomonas lens, Strain RHODO" /LENGTH=250 /DNA_ID=CAMNT_0019207117 /DNA_START=99 /DNA_END=851 /DNA_ORIENTATION=+